MGHKVLHVIDWILLLTILVFVIYAKISGYYIEREVNTIEVCNGIPQTAYNEETGEMVELDELLEDIKMKNGEGIPS